MNPEKQHASFKFKDVLFMESGCEILVDTSTVHLFSSEGHFINTFAFKDMVTSVPNVQCERAIRIGRNILVAFTNSFALGHF